VFFHVKPPADGQINVLLETGGQTFTGIGRIRISTADPQPGMVIIFVSFIYYPEDKVFSEELVLKIRDFREIITDYISSFTVEDLQNQEEENIKLELLKRFNALLRLGQIETLYFSDFMIIG
jgi:flagellar basal body-associated protein FliL